MAVSKFSNNCNPLIDEGDAFETASKLYAVLNFMAGAALSDAVGAPRGKEGCSLILDMCAEAALYVMGQTNPSKNNASGRA